VVREPGFHEESPSRRRRKQVCEIVDRTSLRFEAVSSWRALAVVDPEEGVDIKHGDGGVGVGVEVGADAVEGVVHEDVIVTAVNRGGDTDTIGAIAGAVAGARFGASQLPDRWLSAIDESNELDSLASQLIQVLSDSKNPQATFE
jgi:hypothetical protein